MISKILLVLLVVLTMFIAAPLAFGGAILWWAFGDLIIIALVVWLIAKIVNRRK